MQEYNQPLRIENCLAGPVGSGKTALLFFVKLNAR